jgi:hypothetical protein
MIGFYNIEIEEDSNNKKINMDHFFNVDRLKEIEHFKKYNNKCDHHERLFYQAMMIPVN